LNTFKQHIIPFVPLFLLAFAARAQPALGPWTFKPVSGEIRLEGRYQYLNSLYGSIEEVQQGPYLIGGILLNSDSYFWRPDILSLSFSGEFNPETRREQYLSLPDRSEIRTLEKIDFRTSVFSKKDISLNTFLNLNNSYYNRENLTNIKSFSKEWGLMLRYANKILPVSFSYRNVDWSQVETESGRSFSLRQNNLGSRFTKSFSDKDKTELSVNYDNYAYSYFDLSQVTNRIIRLSLTNVLFFNDSRKYNLHSSLNHYDHMGNQQYVKTDIAEHLLLHLPARLDLNTYYNLNRMLTPGQQIVVNRGRGVLKHRLYESLTSELFADLSGTAHTVYRENSLKTGVNLSYSKKIRFGRLSFDYRYFRQNTRMESEQTSINIINEEHTFDETGELYLNKPYVEDGSVIITDITGTLIYQEGQDFILDLLNTYVRVTRIPGGLIEPDQTVLLSYTATQPGSNSYTANNQSFGASLLLFDRIADIYFRLASQDFVNVEAPDFLVLNTYRQQIAGIKISYSILNGGVEFDNYNSSVIPYRRINYFLNANIRAGSRILISFNGSYRDYKMLASDLDQQYTNLSCRIAGKITANSKINLQAGYLSQNGKNINLELITTRAELAVTKRKLTFLAGIIFYDKKYENSMYTSFRTYLRLIRKF